jgi:BirA family biotin operon repressor/biotin-[acetyl-CoA-carboxylase] ligase
MTLVAPALPEFFRLHAHETIGSTMEECRRLAGEGAPEGSLVWAGEQTEGRGRRGRGWASPPGNLYLSLLLRPDLPPADGAKLGFVAALAMGGALAALLPDGDERVRLKWPNDLLIDGAKTAGILLEGQPGPGGRLSWVILGVGVNVGSYPSDTPYPATSLQAAGGPSDLALLLAGFAERFPECYDSFRRQGFGPIRAAWMSRAAGIGQAIVVRLEQETVTGRFSTLDEEGRLWLEFADGSRRSFTAGDVFFPGL